MSTQELVELLDREKTRDCLAQLTCGEERRNAELITGVLAMRHHRPRHLHRLVRRVPGVGGPRVPGYPRYTACSGAEPHRPVLGHCPCRNPCAGLLPGGHTRGTSRHRDRRPLPGLDGENRRPVAHLATNYALRLVPGSRRSRRLGGGLMDMPFDTNCCAGRAIGDPSEQILGDRWTPEKDDDTK
jgi:hypothetical protein